MNCIICNKPILEDDNKNFHIKCLNKKEKIKYMSSFNIIEHPPVYKEKEKKKTKPKKEIKKDNNIVKVYYNADETTVYY